MNTRMSAQEKSVMPDMDEQTRLLYGRKVKEARQRVGRTQADVASASGVARNTLADMESGKRAPQMEKLWAVMLELGLRPERHEPEWLQEWWRVIEPLALQLPPETRGVTFGKIIGLLHQSIRG